MNVVVDILQGHVSCLRICVLLIVPLGRGKLPPGRVVCLGEHAIHRIREVTGVGQDPLLGIVGVLFFKQT